MDDKGRLFGKINLIDLIVILIVIAVVAAVAWKVVGAKLAEAMEPELPIYEYEVVCPQVYPEVSDFAEGCVGDQLLNNDGLLEGEIVEVVSRPHQNTTLDNNNGAGQSEEPPLRDVYFTIRCRVTPQKDAVAIGMQELRVGRGHIVKSTKLELNGGIILSMRELDADAWELGDAAA